MARAGEIATNNRDDQERAISFAAPAANCHGVHQHRWVQKVLSEKEWLDTMQQKDFRGLTPLFYSHVTHREIGVRL